MKSLTIGSTRACLANVMANCMRRPWSVEWAAEHRRQSVSVRFGAATQGQEEASENQLEPGESAI